MSHTGAMIALFPDKRYLGRMARAAQDMPHAQSIDDLHVTVCYLGKAAELDKAVVVSALQAFSPPVPMPLLLRIRGLDRFPTREDDGTNALYARIICPELHTLRDGLIAALDAVGVEVRNDFGSYTPHMTLGYAPEYLPTPNVRIPLITIPVYAIQLNWADDEPMVFPMTEQVATKEVSGPMATAAHGPGGLFSNPALGSTFPLRRRNVTTKPFVSRAQQRFAFGTGQPWAKRWADETDFSKLPKRAPKKRKKAEPGTLGALFAGFKAYAEGSTAGSGGKGYGARAGETIRGNLARGGNGQFTPAGSGSSYMPKPPKAPKKPKGGGKGSGAKPKKPKAPKEPKLTPEERRAKREAERAAEQAENRAKVIGDLGLLEDAAGALEDLRVNGLTADDGGLEKLGLAEQTKDGQYRLTAAGKAVLAAANRGDSAGAKAALSKGSDRAAEQRAAAEEAAAAEAESATEGEEKPKGGGGGGGGKKEDPADPKDLARLARAGAGGSAPTGAAGGATSNAPMPKPLRAGPNREAAIGAFAERVGIGRSGLRALRGAAEGRQIDSADAAPLVRAGLATRVGDGYEATDQGRQALSAVERGNMRNWQSALQNAGNRLDRETAAAQRETEREEAERKREAVRRERVNKKVDRVAPDAPLAAQKVKRTHAYWKTYRAQRMKGLKPFEARKVAREMVLRHKLGRNERQQSELLSALYNQSVRQVVHTAKADGGASFAVLKTSRGLRWLAISSNNYEDRDREIVSKAALDADVARTAQDGRYGPLRWWHLGEPDPLADEPWGPGLDLGMCDFAAMDDRFLIESGTFNDEEIGEAIAAKAPQLALSIGFFHPRGEPDAEGVFHHIRRFERSLAPAGKVSNPLTAFYVPGATSMAMQDTQLKALADLLPGVPEEKIKALIESSTSQAQKTAEAAGLRYKADVDDKIATLESQIAALKAEMKAPEAEAPPAEEAEEEEGSEEYAGDMTLDQFKAIIGEVVEKAIGGIGSEMKALNARMNMAEKMGGMFDEMKAMFGGIQQKDAAKAERIETIETAIKTLSSELAELRGDQPAAVVAASKSARTALPAGGEPPVDKFTVKTPDDKPAYAHPADQIGSWLEGSMAD